MGVSLQSKSINVYSVFGVEFTNRESAENFSIELKESVDYKYYTIYCLPTEIAGKYLYRRGILFGVSNDVPFEELTYRLMDLYGRMYKLDGNGNIYTNILIEEVKDVDDYKLAQIINNPLVIFDHNKLSEDSIIDASTQRIETIGKIHVENKRSKGIKFDDDLGDEKVIKKDTSYEQDYEEEVPQNYTQPTQQNQPLTQEQVNNTYPEEEEYIETYDKQNYYNVEEEVQQPEQPNPQPYPTRQTRLNHRKKANIFKFDD